MDISMLIPDLTIEEIKKFGLTYTRTLNSKDYHGIHRCVWQGYGEVWATAVSSATPYYRIYDRGTNDLLVLRYQNEIWEAISVNDIKSLYAVLWQMATALRQK